MILTLVIADNHDGYRKIIQKSRECNGIYFLFIGNFYVNIKKRKKWKKRHQPQKLKWWIYKSKLDDR